MQKDLYKTKSTDRNKIQADLIKNGLEKFKSHMNKMFQKEIEIEKPDEIVDIVEKILDFNNQNKEAEGLQMLTPEQMLSRLPIFLAQLEAGNNSEKLKNDIRQLLYSLYCSKKLSKTIYKNLISVS